MVCLRLRHIGVITTNLLRSGIEQIRRSDSVTDTQTDTRTDRQTHGRTNIKFWGPSTQKALKGKYKIDDEKGIPESSCAQELPFGAECLIAFERQDILLPINVKPSYGMTESCVTQNLVGTRSYSFFL